MPQGAVRGDREKKKPKKDKTATKALTKRASMPMHVDVVPKKRKPREDEDDDEE